MHKSCLHVLAAAALSCASAAAAEPLAPFPDAVELLPVTAGSHPFNGAAHQVQPIDLASYHYTEEEYLVAGRARVYDWTPGGNFAVVPLGSSTYTTRIMVRRPADLSAFSGRVVMEVINMSADYDWTAMWGALWERVIANGDAWVGITSKPNVIPGLIKFDPGRYGRLGMPAATLDRDEECVLQYDDITYRGLTADTESGLAWDMFTQLGSLLKSDDAMNPLGVPADRVIFTGESQSGNYAITYFKFFQSDATTVRDGGTEPVFDAFLLEAATTPAGVPIRQCAAALPDDDPQVTVIPGRGVPLAMINSQWDFFPARGGRRKPDANTRTDKSVTWELAGAHHGWRWQYLYSDADHDDLAKAGLVSAEWTAWNCTPERPEVPLYMAEKALYEHLVRWVEHGVAPPAAEPIRLTADGRVAYDDYGTALGGLRLPMIAVPVASYGEGLAVLSPDCAEIVPFGTDKLQALYGTRAAYLDAYRQSLQRLVRDGFLLGEDAPKLMAVAEAVPFAFAASAAGTASPADESPRYLAASYNVVPDADLDTGVPGTTVSTKENQLAIGMLRFAAGNATVDFGLDYQYTRYVYEELDSRNRDLHNIRFPFRFDWRHGGWDIEGYLAPGISTSSNVLRNPFDRLSGDDFIVTARAEASKAWRPGRSWLAGLVYDRAFGEPRLYPSLGVRWQTGSGLDLRLAFPDPAARYAINDRHSITASVFPAGNEWHVLTDDLSDEFDYSFEALRSQLTWSYRMRSRFTIDVSLGYEFDRRHRLEDASASTVEADAASEIMLAIGLRLGDAPVLYTHGAHL